MDSYSSQFSNAILGNHYDDAVVEITMTGPVLKFLEPTLIAVSGANILPKLNDMPINMNMAIQVKPNDILSFGRLKFGLRTYLAVKGGILSDTVLQSRSMYNLITPNHRVKDNDMFNYQCYDSSLMQRHAKVKYDYSLLEDNILEAYIGPEFDSLPDEMQEQILNADLIVSKFNNRMAYQLEPLFKNTLKQILTAPVLPGTVQLTPSGQLIVLMRDCQTTGGYPRVFQLTEQAINILSQNLTGNNLKIRLKD
jgi:allophanate hydrolase subunit 2